MPTTFDYVPADYFFNAPVHLDKCPLVAHPPTLDDTATHDLFDRLIEGEKIEPVVLSKVHGTVYTQWPLVVALHNLFLQELLDPPSYARMDELRAVKIPVRFILGNKAERKVVDDLQHAQRHSDPVSL